MWNTNKRGIIVFASQSRKFVDCWVCLALHVCELIASIQHLRFPRYVRGKHASNKVYLLGLFQLSWKRPRQQLPSRTELTDTTTPRLFKAPPKALATRQKVHIGILTSSTRSITPMVYIHRQTRLTKPRDNETLGKSAGGLFIMQR